MTLPLLPGGVGNRRRLIAGAALMLMTIVGPRGAVAADDDPYAATVTVDATSESVAKARDIARIDGQRRALTQVVEKLTGGPGKAKLPKLSDNAITDLVANFEVANEKMTAVRYIADYTFHFRPDPLKKTLQQAGIAIADPSSPAAPPADSGAKPVVVLPVLQTGDLAVLWEDPNPWRQAWSARPVGNGPTRLMVPLGEVDDVTAIDAEKAQSGDATALGEIARKNGADEVLVMLAVLRATGEKGGLDVTVRRYRLGQSVDVHSDSIDAKPGESQDALCRRAADTIAADLDTGWKNAKEPPAGPQASLVATVPITGLDDWLKLRDRISAVPGVRKLAVKSLSRQEAVIEIQYVGDLDQLKASLAQINLGLEGGDPNWRLARSAADRP